MTTELFKGKIDNVYMNSKRPVYFDESTSMRDRRTIESLTPMSGGFSAPLINGRRYDFIINNETDSIIQFNTCKLEFETYIYGIIGGPANGNPTSSIPSWNAIPGRINEISLTCNNSGETIYHKNNNDYLHAWNASIMSRGYDMRLFNEKSDIVFCPITSSQYTYKEANSADYAQNVAQYYKTDIITDNFKLTTGGAAAAKQIVHVGGGQFESFVQSVAELE